jgi:hypothetical protein
MSGERLSVTGPSRDLLSAAGLSRCGGGDLVSRDRLSAAKPGRPDRGDSVSGDRLSAIGSTFEAGGPVSGGDRLFVIGSGRGRLSVAGPVAEVGWFGES